VILRLRSTKLGPIRFVGHRDMGRVWERVVRRLALPVVYSAGFTPRPRISFGLALPLGAESVAEYIDVELDGTVDLGAGLLTELSDAAPTGVDVTGAALLERPVRSLQQTVTSTTWSLRIPEPGIDDERPADAVARVLEADEVSVTRVRKAQTSTDEVRASIKDLWLGDHPGEVCAELSALGRTLRPSELCSVLFERHDPADVRIRRLAQWTCDDGSRREVLPLPDDVTATPGRLRKDSDDRSTQFSIWRRHDPFIGSAAGRSGAVGVAEA
jgi:radical SAM-linked protein